MEIIMLATKIQLLYELLIHIHILGVKKRPSAEKRGTISEALFRLRAAFQNKSHLSHFQGKDL